MPNSEQEMRAQGLHTDGKWYPARPLEYWDWKRCLLWLWKKYVRAPICHNPICKSWNTEVLGEWEVSWAECRDCGYYFEGDF